MMAGEPGSPVVAHPAVPAPGSPAPPTGGADADLSGRVLSALLAMQRQSWEQGIASHALLDLGLDDLAECVARDAATRQTAAGKLGEIEDHGIVNSAALGEVVLWAADRLGDTGLHEAYDRQLHWVRTTAPRADDGTLFHIEGNREVWVDTVYMVVPLLVQAGHVDEAVYQVAGHRERLFDEEAGLYSHKWDEDHGLTRAAHWGSGNGWVAAGLARAVRLGSGPRRELRPLLEHAQTVIDACLAHRRADGLFHDVVDDPTTFVETNLAQMLAYAVACGVADGWLPGTYAALSGELLDAARSRVDRHGFVTGACGAPRFDRPGTSAEAQSFFLLATRAGQRLRTADGAVLAAPAVG